MKFKGRPFKIVIRKQDDCYELMGHNTIVDDVKDGFFKHKHRVKQVITTDCEIIPVTNTNCWIDKDPIKDGQKVTIKVESAFCPECGHVSFRFYSKDKVYCGRCLNCMGVFIDLKTKKKIKEKKTGKKKVKK